MTVELLYFHKCPHVQNTFVRVAEVLDDLGLNVPMTARIVSEEEVTSLRFLGSPSVRINGVDIEPSARSRTDFGMMCRRYEDGSGVPAEELIRAAVLEAIGKSRF